MMRRTRHQSGYNLVEVLVAMGLLSTILLAITTLFYFGRRNVYSGKQMTSAVAVGTNVLEDLSGLNRGAFYNAFNIGTSAGQTNSTTTNTVEGVAYTNSILRDTTAATPANDTAGFLSRWKAMLPHSTFQDANLYLIITPLVPNGPNPIRDAGLVRARVVIAWQEGQRRRQLVMDSFKSSRLPGG
jgi:prepilin-type N-terminal cleavage/methylation domain-containing protein